MKLLNSELLDFTWKPYGLPRRSLSLICRPLYTLANMTLDEKVRYGMVALGGASVILATLGVHISPLEIIGGMGTT